MSAPAAQPDAAWPRRLVAAAAILRARRRRVPEIVREAALDRGAIAVIALVLMAAAPALSFAALDLPLALGARQLGAETRWWFLTITQFGESQPYLISLAVAFVAFIAAALAGPIAWRRWSRWCAQASLFVFVAAAGSGLAVHVIKFAVGRSRPRLYFNEGIYGAFPLTFGSGYASFPSGHTVTAVALAAALGMLWRPSLILLAPLAVLVAASRVALGAHWLGDTFAGCGLALIFTIWLRWRFAEYGLAFRLTDHGRIVTARPGIDKSQGL